MLDILKTEPAFCSYVRQVAAGLYTHKTWCQGHNIGFSWEGAIQVMALASELKTKAQEHREHLNQAQGASPLLFPYFLSSLFVISLLPKLLPAPVLQFLRSLLLQNQLQMRM